MFQDQRVIHDGTDISAKVNDFRAGSYDFEYQAGEYVYIGSIMPFNNLWWETKTPNTNADIISIDLWFGNAWVSAVDIIDQTNGLNQTGRITWNTNRLKGWDREQDSSDVTGISSFSIYNKFWLRVSWDANFSAASTLDYIGQKFSTDDVLYSYYPDLNLTSLKESFEAGKTSWDEQHYMAADYIVSELKKRNVVQSRSQLMDWSIFEEAACHRIAELVYIAQGEPYFDQLLEARKSFKNAMNMKFFLTDVDQDGSLDPVERKISTGFLTR